MSEKASFSWASIAGADPEPVEVIERDGRRAVLTIGCPDPFFLDDEAACVRLDWAMMNRPNLVTTQAERERASAAYEAKKRAGVFTGHSWRGSR